MADPLPTEHRRERWEHAAEWPLTVAALIFLAAYAWPILDGDLAAPWPAVCRTATWLAWSAFAADYVVRLALSARRGHSSGRTWSTWRSSSFPCSARCGCSASSPCSPCSTGTPGSRCAGG
ncbi:hypothetical protein [Blastococcus brunescens]|uniref:Uncharacterized protein n=1 Tax=Blastococcus brunescens TaxID=1564165 RepID=A0ABZ1B679_9ACTN|nr:hypothetical protein [Blastococcus sp. BMG 8361]WRL65363.1 hypothetical protein U6N30_06935 [Blastococcus sp. BMG 8361]